MKKYSIKTIQEVVSLRRSGKSIPEIVASTRMPKTTVWQYVKDIKISERLKTIIRSRQGGSTKRLEIDWKRAMGEAQSMLGNDAQGADLCRLVAMLYWAEGSKREFVFTNTDPDMISLFLRFAQDCLQIKKADIHVLIRISDPIKESEALSYWRKKTRCLNSNIQANHNNLQNKTKTQYGICRVSVRKSGYYLKVIKCIIDIVKKEMSPL